MVSLDLALLPALARVLAWCEHSPRRAVAAARRIVAVDSTPEAQLALGWALLSSERFAAARAPLELALPALALPAQQYFCRLGLLSLEQQTLAHPRLDEAFAALADECAAAGAGLLAAWVRLDQARQLNILGRAPEAEGVLVQIAPTLDAAGPLGAGRVRRAMAVAAYRQGDYERAERLLDAAEAHFRPARLLLDRARCWFERAVIALYREHLDAAFALYGDAGRVAGRAGLPLRSALCLRGSGAVAIRQGRYDLALRQTRAAADLFLSLGRDLDAAICTVHLGNIFLHTGQSQAAFEAYAGAEARFLALGLLGDRTMARRNRAMALRALGRLDEAWQLLEHVEREALALSFSGEVAETHSVQAAILADTGRLDAADARYHEAQAEFLRLGNVPAAAECRLEQGWLALRRGDPAAAEALFEPLPAAFADQPHHRWRALYGLGRSAELRGDPGAATARYAEASVVVAGLRRRLASEAASSGIFATASDLFADALHLADRQGDPAALLALTEDQRALTLWRLLVAPPPAEPAEARPEPGALLVPDGQEGPDLDRAMAAYAGEVLGRRHGARALPDLEALIPAARLDPDQIRAVLSAAFGHAWTVLAYSFDDGRLHRIMLSGAGLTVDSVPDTKALRRLIGQASLPAYRYYTYADVPLAQGSTTSPWQRLKQLAGLLLPEALGERLHPGHRLLIVPAGPLHTLPWAALRAGDAWLAERAVIHMLPSLSVAPLLTGRRPSGDQGLLIGCGEFGARAPALPGVAAELAAVAARWPGPSTSMRDAAATIAGLRRAIDAAPPALLHVASHARLLPARGLVAHLKLWDADLLLAEVTDLGLSGALVTLSTCDGAAAEVLPGEEVLSLSWGFLAGGASAVLASLWPVGDQQTLPVIEALYDGLAARRDPALALALAQRQMLAGADPETAAAQVWGSFVAVGGLGPW